MRKAAIIAGALVFALGLAESAEAKRPRCKKRERWVEAGTPVFGGPGLGFETVAVTKGGECLRVLRSTDDGSFALVPVEKGRVGWVATGLVDAKLSEDAKAAPVAADVKAVKALLEAALREGPRVDATAIGVVKRGADLTVKGRSPDGLWLLVEEGKREGWIPRYQTAESLPEAGAPPSAGTGPWSVRSTTDAPTPDAEEAKKGSGEERTVKGEAGDDGKKGEGTPQPGDAPAGDEGPSESRPLLGRTQDLSITVTPVAHWSQRYLSNAQNDPFHKYALESFGGGAALGYAWRGDLPLVVDTRMALGVFGFDIAVPGANGQPLSYYRSVATVDSSASVGWRLVASEGVDVEAGAGMGLSFVWIEGIDDGQGNITPAFTPGMYLHLLRPHVAARSRLGGGELGLLVLEAALPVGTYVMLDDPGDRYLQARAAGTVQPPNEPPRPVDPAEPAPAAEQGAPFSHLGFGVEGRVRYLYPLGDLMRFDTSAGVEIRQALIEGPGLRVKGAYSEATNIDVTASVTVGLDFAF